MHWKATIILESRQVWISVAPNSPPVEGTQEKGSANDAFTLAGCINMNRVTIQYLSPCCKMSKRPANVTERLYYLRCLRGQHNYVNLMMSPLTPHHYTQ